MFTGLIEDLGKVNNINKFVINKINIRASSSAINNKMIEKLKNF